MRGTVKKSIAIIGEGETALHFHKSCTSFPQIMYLIPLTKVLDSPNSST